MERSDEKAAVSMAREMESSMGLALSWPSAETRASRRYVIPLPVTPLTSPLSCSNSSMMVRTVSTGMVTSSSVAMRLPADLVRRFGGTHFALAGYNAGEFRVSRWIAERPDLDRDEFIDDIPFPETQNYLKRILGTAEDYRRLYGAREKPAGPPRTAVKPAAKPPARPPAKTPAAKAPTPAVKK